MPGACRQFVGLLVLIFLIPFQVYTQDHQHNQKASTARHPLLIMMDSMMTRMDGATLDGSVERNFLLQMIPHHQGALEMARHEIAQGKNPEMIQLARSILAEQQSEIMEMKVMLEGYPSGGELNPAYQKAMDGTMAIMMKNTPTDATLGTNPDCNFAAVMLPHHQAAVDMAAAILRFNPQGPVDIYSKRIIADQQIEIEQMQSYLQQHCKHQH